jgi:hypothetical protein
MFPGLVPVQLAPLAISSEYAWQDRFEYSRALIGFDAWQIVIARRLLAWHRAMKALTSPHLGFFPDVRRAVALVVHCNSTAKIGRS